MGLKVDFATSSDISFSGVLEKSEWRKNESLTHGGAGHIVGAGLSLNIGAFISSTTLAASQLEELCHYLQARSAYVTRIFQKKIMPCCYISMYFL